MHESIELLACGQRVMAGVQASHVYRCVPRPSCIMCCTSMRVGYLCVHVCVCMCMCAPVLCAFVCACLCLCGGVVVCLHGTCIFIGSRSSTRCGLLVILWKDEVIAIGSN